MRASDWDPTSHRVDRVDAAGIAPVLAREVEVLDGGRIAVVIPRPGSDGTVGAADLAADLAALLPRVRIGAGADALDDDVAVLTVEEVELDVDGVVAVAKALERTAVMHAFVGAHGKRPLDLRPAPRPCRPAAAAPPA